MTKRQTQRRGERERGRPNWDQQFGQNATVLKWRPRTLNLGEEHKKLTCHNFWYSGFPFVILADPFCEAKFGLTEAKITLK